MGRNLHIAALGLLLLALSKCAAISSSTTPDAKIDEPSAKGPVGKTFHANREKFLRCARDSVTIQTGSNQEILLDFEVDAEGRVIKSRIEKMSMGDPDLHDCVLARLRQIRFPKPKDGAQKKLHYPLVLKPN